MQFYSLSFWDNWTQDGFINALGVLFDGIKNSILHGFFGDFSSYVSYFINILPDIVKSVKSLIASIPPIFSIFISLSLIVSISYLAVGRGRVN